MAAAKIDLKKTFRQAYAPPLGRLAVVDVQKIQFLMIDGAGDPGGPDCARAVEALFATAYAIKFMVKHEGSRPDFVAMPLEGLWWADDHAVFLSGERARWHWTMMIAIPDHVHSADIAVAREEVEEKRMPTALKIRHGHFEEGPAMQVLYVGPYAEEGPVIASIHAHIHTMGKRLHGKHHEIYLSDPRRTAPEKLKTILRQPFA